MELTFEQLPKAVGHFLKALERVGDLLDNLPGPETIAEDIIENLEAGLESFREIMVKLSLK
jgi:type I restriction enzyme M protein